MKANLFYLVSMLTIPASIISMDGDQPPADKQVIFEQLPKNPLQAVVVEKVKTLKEVYDNGKGVVPYKDNTALNCAKKYLISLDDLSTLRTHWHLHNLTDINFSYNKIEKLPKELFFECPNLVVLGLAHNKLKEIDPNLPNHQNLTALYLHNNEFTGRFPLAYLWQSAPLVWLTLYNNPGITDFGDMPHKCTTQKQIFIDYTAPEEEKLKIARQCPNLEAEICNLGTHVQDEHSYTEYTQEYWDTSGFGACWGLCGTLSGFVGLGVSLGLGYQGLIVFGSVAGAAAGGLVIGTVAGSQIAVHCCLKPEERQELTLTRKIEARPSMLTHFENEESSSDSSDTGDEEEDDEHNSWSSGAKKNETDNS